MSDFSHAEIKKIVIIPEIAWPTLALLSFSISCQLLSIYFLSCGKLSEFSTILMNTLFIYISFTPLHDAAHGSIFGKKFRFLNDIVGYLAASCFPLPYNAFKHLHLQHHRYTNMKNDPDLWAGSGPTFLLPLKWLTIEMKYYFMYLSKISQRPFFEASVSLFNIFIIASSIFLLFKNGYGRLALFGWIIPGRLANSFLAFFFDYLPHRPHSISRDQNVYEATCVTSLYSDKTSFLTWPLLHQNYHNIHHLAPYIPFYLYSSVWKALNPILLRKGTKIKPIF